jgi:hypothetical protein
MDTKDKAKSASYLDLHIDTDTINNFNVSIVSVYEVCTKCTKEMMDRITSSLETNDIDGG